MLRFVLSKKLNIPIKWLPGENSGVIRSVSFIKTLTLALNDVISTCWYAAHLIFQAVARRVCLKIMQGKDVIHVCEKQLFCYIFGYLCWPYWTFLPLFSVWSLRFSSLAGFKRDSLNLIRLLRVVMEGETTRSNRMNFRLQKREHFSNRAAIAAILVERLTWEAGVGCDKHLYLNGWQ